MPTTPGCDMLLLNGTAALLDPQFCRFLWLHETVAAALFLFSATGAIFACLFCHSSEFILLLFLLALTSPFWEIGVPLTIAACCCRAAWPLEPTCCCWRTRREDDYAASAPPFPMPPIDKP